jgi:hypothetical protein
VKQRLQQLNNNCSLLLPYYCLVKNGINGKKPSLPEEYGFIFFTKQQNEIKGVGYNPSNNQIVNLYLKNYFESLSSEIIVKYLSLNTTTPVSSINSGPWVIMQIQAILNQKIDLIAKPHKLVPETNLSSIRLSQCSFLLTSAVRNRHAATTGAAVPRIK